MHSLLNGMLCFACLLMFFSYRFRGTRHDMKIRVCVDKVIGFWGISVSIFAGIFSIYILLFGILILSFGIFHLVVVRTGWETWELVLPAKRVIVSDVRFSFQKTQRVFLILFRVSVFRHQHGRCLLQVRS